jgi:von Willebrand factor type A domain
MLGFAVYFLTPRAAWLAVLVLVPLVALAVATRRVERVRRALRLPAAGASDRRRRRAALLVAVVLLFVLAAMQPAVRAETSVRERSDAAAFVVVDVSRSMAASHSPGSTTRLARARLAALALGTELEGIPLGVATLTDRVLPNLFPTSDTAAFDSTVASLTANSPPPRDVNTVATTFDGLTALATEGFFRPSVHKRAVVLITDGESRAFDPAGIADVLRSHGTALSVIRVGDGADRVWRSDGKPEANFRPDPAGARLNVARLERAAGVASGADPTSVVRRAVGTGPTSVVGVAPRSRTLAPYVAALALLPLALLLVGRISPEWLRRVTFWRRTVADPEGAAA